MIPTGIRENCGQTGLVSQLWDWNPGAWGSGSSAVGMGVWFHLMELEDTIAGFEV